MYRMVFNQCQVILRIETEGPGQRGDAISSVPQAGGVSKNRQMDLIEKHDHIQDLVSR